MVWITRVLRVGTLVALTAAVTGCIVLPYGARGHHGHHATSSDGRSSPQPMPQEYRRHR